MIHIKSSYSVTASLENFLSTLNIEFNSMVRSNRVTFSCDRETDIFSSWCGCPLRSAVLSVGQSSAGALLKGLS